MVRADSRILYRSYLIPRGMISRIVCITAKHQGYMYVADRITGISDVQLGSGTLMFLSVSA